MDVVRGICLFGFTRVWGGGTAFFALKHAPRLNRVLPQFSMHLIQRGFQLVLTVA
jgi:hypothetical protein